VASGSRTSLALEVKQVLVGFPASALNPNEAPAHCSSAAGLLADSKAVEHCLLVGPTGQISAKGGRPPLEAHLSARISNLTIFMGRISRIGKGRNNRVDLESPKGNALRRVLTRIETTKNSLRLLEAGVIIEHTQTILHPVKVRLSQ